MFRLQCLLLLMLLFRKASTLQCRNADGHNVDWFAMYKLPKLSDSNITMVQRGLGVVYLDGKSSQWRLSNHAVNSTKQAIYQTLAPLYNKELREGVMYFLYNDENPDGSRNDHHGHTKGVVAFDQDAGFWLVHSVPRFPSLVKNGYRWPENEFYLFGQSFLCISFPYETLDDIGRQLFFNYPHVYELQVPTDFQKRFPILKDVGHNHPAAPPWFSVRELASLGNVVFTSFAKFTALHADLYGDLVAPGLKRSLLVETWRRGKNNLNSNCTGPFQVLTVESIKLETREGAINFKVTEDHAKWAVSKDGGDWVCIGDINRQKSQFKRGGGTVCFQNHAVWKTYRYSVNDFDSCSAQKHETYPDFF